MEREGLSLEPEPGGKKIERIVIVREDVFSQTDPWPSFLNRIHITTLESIVRQELLISEGDLWNEERISETERNLRNLLPLSLAEVFPCQGSSPETLILLVVTKDLWSLRTNSSFDLSGSTLLRGDLFPTEINLAGRAKELGLHLGVSQQELFGPNRNYLVFGQRYIDPRVNGTRFRFGERVDFFVNGKVPCGGATSTGGNVQSEVWCPDSGLGSFQGLEGELFFAKPLYSLASKWGYSISALTQIRQIRQYRFNSSGTSIPLGEREGISLRTVSFDPGDGTIRAVPRVYDLFTLSLVADLTRSYGLKTKNDFTFGMRLFKEDRDPPSGFPFDAQTRDWFLQSVLPRSLFAEEFFFRYSHRGTDYIKLRNIEAFAVNEDFLLGPQFSTTLTGGIDLDQVDRSYWAIGADASYRWAIEDNLLRIFTDASIRWQPELNEIDPNLSGDFANMTVAAGIRNISPRFLYGRFHQLLSFRIRHNDLNRSVALLNLRGYSDNQFEGKNIFLTQSEFRTLPMNLNTFHLGGVLFYEGGAVFDGEDPLNANQSLPFRYRQSVGLGLRGQFPQFDRSSFRLDIGIPLDTDSNIGKTYVSASYGQVF